MRTRVMLECGSYREVTRPVRRELLVAARGLLATMDDSSDPEDFHRADLAFHLELVKLSGNSVATMLLTSLRNAIESYVAAALVSMDDWDATARGLQREHRDLVEVLEAGDGDRASDIAARHILGFARRADLLHA